MGHIIRRFFYFLGAVLLICQIPFVQKQIVKIALPSSMQLVEMKSYGLFPIYMKISKLHLKKEGQDFLFLKKGTLDLRHLFFHWQIAFIL